MTDHAPSRGASRPLQPARPRGRAGLSLVEVCISLAISAALLVAVGAAYSSSVHAIQSNDTFFRATQSARVSLNQILTQLRECQSVTVATNSLAMTTYSGQSVTYAWSSASSQLTITPQTGSSPPTYTMAGSVTACAFATDTKTVTMMITVQAGNNTVTFSGAATPRRMVQYN